MHLNGVNHYTKPKHLQILRTPAVPRPPTMFESSTKLNFGFSDLFTYLISTCMNVCEKLSSHSLDPHQYFKCLLQICTYLNIFRFNFSRFMGRGSMRPFSKLLSRYVLRPPTLIETIIVIRLVYVVGTYSNKITNNDDGH